MASPSAAGPSRPSTPVAHSGSSSALSSPSQPEASTSTPPPGPKKSTPNGKSRTSSSIDRAGSRAATVPDDEDVVEAGGMEDVARADAKKRWESDMVKHKYDVVVPDDPKNE
jgi:hypothetical protein